MMGKFADIGPIRKRLRVLIVHDQNNTANRVAWFVRRWGHTGYSVSPSVNALQIAAAKHPHVALLDMEMPLMDGCTFAHQLRCSFPGDDCFIIACTEQANDPLRQRSIESGIDLLLPKPVDLTLLEMLLRLERELVNRSRNDNVHVASFREIHMPPTGGARRVIL